MRLRVNPVAAANDEKANWPLVGIGRLACALTLIAVLAVSSTAEKVDAEERQNFWGKDRPAKIQLYEGERSITQEGAASPSRGHAGRSLRGRSPQALADVRGVYIASYPSGKFNYEMLKQEGVDGVFIRLPWFQVNPSPDRYDFRRLGQLLDLVVRARKKASVAIMAGAFTPKWVFDRSGSRALPLEMKRDPGGNGGNRIPVPWDGKFQKAHGKMIGALASFITGKAEYDRAVVMVKMAGIVMGSAEMRLIHPRLLAEKSYSWGAERNRAFRQLKRDLRGQQRAAWQRTGYRPSRVFEAAHVMLLQVADSFPNKVVGLAILVDPASFPAIGEEGGGIELRQVRTTARVILDAANAYGQRFAVNSTMLMPRRGTPPVIDNAHNQGAQTGYQVAEQHIGHPFCNGRGDTNKVRRDPCDPEAFRQAMRRAIARGASFVEVFDHNAEAYPEILLETSRALKAR